MGGLGVGFTEEKEGTVIYVGGMRDSRSEWYILSNKCNLRSVKHSVSVHCVCVCSCIEKVWSS